ncbi:MAG: hypothetical protein AAB267_01970, partial [Candidatus Desantisbacteria bacterium]
MKKTFLCVVLGLVLGQGAWCVPNLINYQGRLTGSGDSPVNGNVDLQFYIYDTPTGGISLWQETQNISVNNGIFNVLLGSSTSLNLPFDKDYWLGVKVGGDNEMIPRQRIVSVGYSLRADYAGTASYAEIAGTGTQGFQGIQGTQGFQGTKGDTGAIGPQGETGTIGDTATFANTATYALDSQKLEGKSAAQLQVGTATWASTATYALSAGGGGGHYIGESYGGGKVFWVDS